MRKESVGFVNDLLDKIENKSDLSITEKMSIERGLRLITYTDDLLDDQIGLSDEEELKYKPNKKRYMERSVDNEND